jgi:hypothetical protein
MILHMIIIHMSIHSMTITKINKIMEILQEAEYLKKQNE